MAATFLKEVPQSAMTATPRAQVIIIGAGPVGLFLALKIAQQGIKVIVLENETDIVKSPRAISYRCSKNEANSRYFPLVVNEMAKVGMADDLLEIGVKNTEGVYFRTPYGKSNEVLARMQWSKIPKEGLKYDFVAVNLGQDDLAAIMLKHARKYDTFEVKWSHRFAGVKQDETGVIVCAVTAQGEKFFKADWLIGCDGAGSAVRRALCIPFEGHTWTVAGRRG
jgi:3-(3-hydroxy-phenyl)propionate hydroxylase